MTPSRRLTASFAAVLTLAAFTPAPAADLVPALTCDQLTAMSWSGLVLDEVSEVAPAANDPAHCRVLGTIDDEIHFELLLPLAEDWNGRFLMGGGGGYVGSVQNQALQFAGPRSVLSRGFATVGTDTGHEGSGIDASWALNRPDREVNFGHRAVHVTAEAAKTIIRLYYGRDIDYSYFLGCSRGGGQGMMSSQRYPDDFDGIVSGAPAYDWTGLGAFFLQTQQALYPDPTDLSTPVITDEAAQTLEAAILGACDGNDGIEDGFMTDPLGCDIDILSIPGLTAEQRRAAEVIYGGAYAGDRHIYPGFPFGGETDAGGWKQWITGGGDGIGPDIPNLHYAFGTQMHKYIIYDAPEFDYSTYDFDNYYAWEEQTRGAGKILNATDTDLSGFKTAGGKLILWNGWSDPAIPASGTLRYYEGVAAGDEDADDYVRMFMLPGVLHCAGGPGPDFVEWIGAIQEWVEEDEAPERLVATKVNQGQVEMQRPVCAWPAQAVYDGSGDPKREDSFECVAP
ncbi:tannase/feruloyl esterase family alpha/beta hydrolase [Candidatus Palauibacter sp.]|uniref:tannase/feruloyl esterase family alpha/beta hydrolase n=1 Tax=Candidatus Palauibacter sp. TaxID=3101350 RepID=UPI003B5B57AD